MTREHTMTREELLTAYKSRRDFIDANLRGATLNGVSLSRAILRRANLHGANLHGADLHDADLRGATLRDANLSSADLRGADLYGADLYGANLHGTNLRGAILSGTNLRGAILSGANLHGADLNGADLNGADLSGADLSCADLPPLSILPAGTLIGWKKLRCGIIAKLEIPASARRVNSTGRKCRAEYVKVLELDSNVIVGHSCRDGTEYRVGTTVRPNTFDPDFRVECSYGIHFFITREEAENYY